MHACCSSKERQDQDLAKMSQSLPEENRSKTKGKAKGNLYCFRLSDFELLGGGVGAGGGVSKGGVY